MGLRFFSRKQDQVMGPSPSEVEGINERYSAYFPRVFAYVHSCVGGDVPAEDIAVEAFTQAFRRARNSNEDRFRTVLFRTARRLCRPALKENKPGEDDPLNHREREILSLVFDAGLTRDQIAQLFRIRETTVSTLLMSGLRKLKEQASPAAAVAYLELA